MASPDPTIPRREVDIGPVGPGPAGYNLPGLIGQTKHDFRSTHVMNPAWSIGGRAYREQESTGPGPGYYSLEKTITRTGRQDAPAYSLGGRTSKDHHETTPGPGAYTTDISGHAAYDTKDGFSIGRRTYNEQKSSGPGPGSYYPNVKTESSKRNDPSWTMGGKPPSTALKTNQPGPADYYPELDRGQGASIKGRPTGGVDSIGPGPGAYAVDSVENSKGTKGPAWTIGGRSASGPAGNEGPGPGAYNVGNQAEPGSKGFSIQGRVSGGHSESGPGPGQYKVEKVTRTGVEAQKGATIKGRSTGFSTESSPGPGAYSLNDKSPGPAFSMGTRNPGKATESSPGPGAYNPTIFGAKKTNPSWTMGGKGQAFLAKTRQPGPADYYPELDHGQGASIKGRQTGGVDSIGPGPGAYAVDFVENSKGMKGPAWTIGGRSASGPAGNEGPGPGAYNVGNQSGPSSKGFSIQGRVSGGHAQSGPGPGQYKVEKVTRTGVEVQKGATIKGRSTGFATDSSPGPGAYSLDAKPPGPAFSMGTRSRGKASDSSPGPGAYNPDQTSSKKKGAAWSIGGRPKTVGKKSGEPGPADYYPELDRGQGASIKGRQTGGVNSIGPGPGAYAVDSVENSKGKKGPAWTIGGRSTSGPTANKGPGPGAYNVGNQTGSKGFSIQGRVSGGHAESGPGPGHYKVENVTRTGVEAQKGATIKGRSTGFSTESSPGPGAYSLKDKPPGPAFSMGTRNTGKASDSSPGPGAYNPDQTSSKKKGAAWSIGGRPSTVGKKSAEPGPADYYPELDRGQGASIKGRQTGGVDSIGPGPGAYAVDSEENSKGTKGPAWTIGGRSASGPAGNEGPGPGAYNVGNQAGPGSKGFSIQGRVSGGYADSGPGPGHYKVEKVTRTGVETQNGATIKGRTTGFATESSPGPGAYSLNDRSPGPAFSMGTRNTGKASDSSPGPGAYNSEKTSNGPAFSIGLRNVKTSHEEGPGPASYDAGVTSSGPSWTLSGKESFKAAEQSPGPGAYNPDQQKDGPAFSIGTREVRSSYESSPGPGAYNPDNRSQGTGFTIAGRHGGNSSDDTPGPGTYYVPKGDNGPAFSMGGRVKGSLYESSPGPGAYTTEISETERTTRGFTMGKRTGLGKTDSSPGPIYMPDPMLGETVRSTKPKAPGVIIGSRNVGVSKAEIGPGPGSYLPDVNGTKGGPSFSFGSRTVSQKHNEVPGPGAYGPLHKPEGKNGGLSFGIRHSPTRGQFNGASQSHMKQSRNSHEESSNTRTTEYISDGGNTTTKTVTTYYNSNDCDPCRNVSNYRTNHFYSSGGGNAQSYTTRLEPINESWASGGGSHTFTRTYETVTS